MNNVKLSSSAALKISASVIFDFALVLAFFKLFGLFFIVNFSKSILALLVLLIGLLIFNGVIIFKSKNIGVPYSASIATLLMLYAIAANVLSVFLISGSIIMYMAWELIIFAAFIFAMSIISDFLKKSSEDIIRVKKEEAEKTSIMLQLMEIEDSIISNDNKELIVSFKTLKERIKASTPFGRISSNYDVLEIENQIKSKLNSLQVDLQGSLKNKNLEEMKKLLDGILRLVINRENLNIK